MKSEQTTIQYWAIKCGTSFSMLEQKLAKDVYDVLIYQFKGSMHSQVWTASITATFELIERYAFNESTAKDFHSITNAMSLFWNFLETLNDPSMMTALITGFRRLILRGHHTSEDLVSKLLLRFFNPATEPKIYQVLRSFFETLINQRHPEWLQSALMNTLFIIFEAQKDNPLHKIKPEDIIWYVIKSTHPKCCSSGVNIHYKIAAAFFKAMDEKWENKELLMLLSKELLTLEVSKGPLIEVAATSLLEKPLDIETRTNIKTFLLGTQKAAISRIDSRDIEKRLSNDNGDIALGNGFTNSQASENDRPVAVAVVASTKILPVKPFKSSPEKAVHAVILNLTSNTKSSPIVGKPNVLKSPTKEPSVDRPPSPLNQQISSFEQEKPEIPLNIRSIIIPSAARNDKFIFRSYVALTRSPSLVPRKRTHSQSEPVQLEPLQMIEPDPEVIILDSTPQGILRSTNNLYYARRKSVMFSKKVHVREYDVNAPTAEVNGPDALATPPVGRKRGRPAKASQTAAIRRKGNKLILKEKCPSRGVYAVNILDPKWTYRSYHDFKNGKGKLICPFCHNNFRDNTRSDQVNFRTHVLNGRKAVMASRAR